LYIGVRSLVLAVLLVVQKFDARQLLRQTALEIFALRISDCFALFVNHGPQRNNFGIRLQQLLDKFLVALRWVREGAQSHSG
jgi:hypothetical protein